MAKFIQGKFVETLSTGFHFTLHLEDAGMEGILCLPQVFQSDSGEALYALLALVESEDALDCLGDIIQALEGHTRETKTQVVLEEMGLSHLPHHGEWALAQIYRLWHMAGKHVEDEEEVFFQTSDVWCVDSSGNRYEAVVEA
jgi:anti-sigma factor ChrR (cupin superfamily)